jgi:hypothetical protein
MRKKKERKKQTKKERMKERKKERKKKKRKKEGKSGPDCNIKRRNLSVFEDWGGPQALSTW